MQKKCQIEIYKYVEFCDHFTQKQGGYYELENINIYK